MNICRFTFNPFGENTYILWDSDTKEAAIVDPGMSTEAECRRIVTFQEKEGLKFVHLLNTHMHIDHVAGDDFISRTYGLQPEYNPADNYLAAALTDQARRFGFSFAGNNITSGIPLNDGDQITVGKGLLEVLLVPGHTRGHVAFYNKQDNFVLAGDVLFQHSIGRTDLPGGDIDTLLNSIRTKLMTLPDNTEVYPGHGPETTIGNERANNPYLYF